VVVPRATMQPCNRYLGVRGCVAQSPPSTCNGATVGVVAPGGSRGRTTISDGLDDAGGISSGWTCRGETPGLPAPPARSCGPGEFLSLEPLLGPLPGLDLTGIIG